MLSDSIRDQVFIFVPNIHMVSLSMCFLLPNPNRRGGGAARNDILTEGVDQNRNRL